MVEANIPLKTVAVIKRQQAVDVYKPEKNLSVIKRQQTINITAEVPMLVAFKPFTFVATEGQTIFPLDKAPRRIILLAINGATQNEEGGDFVLSGSNITLSAGVSAGDNVYGIYQEP